MRGYIVDRKWLSAEKNVHFCTLAHFSEIGHVFNYVPYVLCCKCMVVNSRYLHIRSISETPIYQIIFVSHKAAHVKDEYFAFQDKILLHMDEDTKSCKF